MNHLKTKLLECTIGQIEDICTLEVQCFDDGAWSHKIIQDTMQVPSKKVLCLKDEYSNIGYIIIQVLENEGDIERIGIVKKYRQRGLGEYLLKKTLDKYHLVKCFLDVNANNIAAVSLYKKCGFSLIQRRKQYYSDGSDALIMEWMMEEHEIK